MRQRLIVAIALLSFTFLPQNSLAQGRAKANAPRGPKVTTKAPRTAAQGPKAPAARGPKATAGGPKNTARGPKATASAKPNATTTATTPRSLPKNPKLVERLRAMLPAGTDINTAADGFRNQGQFVAAVHVSNNLGIPFADLKTQMVTDQKSLGQAIQTLRPAVDAAGESQRASRQADADLGVGGDAKKRPQK